MVPFTTKTLRPKAKISAHFGSANNKPVGLNGSNAHRWGGASAVKNIINTLEVETPRPESHSRAVGGAKEAEVEWTNCEESGTMSIHSVFG